MQLSTSTMLSDFTIEPVSLVHSGAAFYRYLDLPVGIKARFRDQFEQHRHSHDGHIFLARDHLHPNQVVGCIYCDLHSQHLSYGKEVPIFGWLQADSHIIAHALLCTAEEYARNAGCSILRGPINPPKLYGWGAVGEGLTYPRILMSSHDRQNMAKWLTTAGYQSETEYIALECTTPIFTPNPFPNLEIFSLPLHQLTSDLLTKLQHFIQAHFTGMLPDGVADPHKFQTIISLLQEVDQPEDFYLIAWDCTTHDLAAFLLEIPNVFDLWNGGELESTCADTAIVAKPYRGIDFFHHLYSTIWLKTERRGIHRHLGVNIWTKNTMAMQSFTKIGKIVMRHMVFQKTLHGGESC